MSDPSQWPTTPPTEPGYYWALVHTVHGPEIVWLRQDDNAVGRFQRTGDRLHDYFMLDPVLATWHWRPGRIEP